MGEMFVYFIIKKRCFFHIYKNMYYISTLFKINIELWQSQKESWRYRKEERQMKRNFLFMQLL